MNKKQWHEFCERLKQAGDLIESDGAPDDDLSRAEGYRYLTRLLRAGLESSVEGSDPRYPVFYSLSTDTIKIGNDNPDNYYLNCCVSGELDYLIEGEFGEVEFFSVATKAGSYATTGDMRPGGEITSDQLNLDQGGGFQIIVSASQPADHTANWLPMTPDSDNLIVRQYCNARRERPARFSIKCLNASEPPVLKADNFSEKLERAVNFVTGTSGIFKQWIEQFKAHTNQLPSNDQAMCIKAGGNANIHYHNSHWRLADDEALIIQPQSIPECEAWNFQVSNYWMESLDYRYYPVSLNNQTAVADKDGAYTLVVAHRDPGKQYPNWLSTAGHNEGGMLFRWINAQEFPPIATRVCKLGELTS
ncbi:MAG: DUF1214 domain-containing protein [Gammaproteobacteria bacterium]|nr:DUF1214 domain-containing protein [Gammaproteobacteria bacterium]